MTRQINFIRYKAHTVNCFHIEDVIEKIDVKKTVMGICAQNDIYEKAYLLWPPLKEAEAKRVMNEIYDLGALELELRADISREEKN